MTSSAVEPNQAVRVVIADDSPTARAVLAELCSRDPAIEVVGQAADGLEAVDLAVKLRPTVVIMDITMPGLDGYEATRRIMTEAPTRVVMVTAANDPTSVEVAFGALDAGALTVLAKPVGPLDPGGEAGACAFVSRVKLLSEVGVIRRHAIRPHSSYRTAPAPPATPTTSHSAERAGVVAVVTSTGGPQALHGFLAGLPSDFALPIVVVQHIVEGFTEGLCRWLNAKVCLRVKIACQGERLHSGTVYVAPDQAHLTITRRHTVALQETPPVGGFRPSANVLLTSVAAVEGPDAIAVVLTGMGSDGLEGARAVAAAGGTVLAQDEATSVVFGMPGVVVAAGLASLVGPVERLSRRVTFLAARTSQ